MTEYEELKPCPFCGTKPGYETFHDGFARIHRIECPYCKVFLDRLEEEDVIAAWNKRTTEVSNERRN